MATTTVKICGICAKDVSHSRRMKDSQGHYYCEPCFSKAMRGDDLTDVIASINDSKITVGLAPEVAEALAHTPPDEHRSHETHFAQDFAGQPGAHAAIAHPPLATTHRPRTMRDCPQCGQAIHIEAHKCRHCNAFITPAAVKAVMREIKHPPAAPKASVAHETPATDVPHPQPAAHIPVVLSPVAIAELAGGEFLVGCDLAGALQRIEEALARLGQIGARDTAAGWIMSQVRVDADDVKVRAQIIAMSDHQTRVQLQAVSDHAAAGKKVHRRVIDTLRHIDDPNYLPADTSSTSRGVWIGLALGLIVAAAAVMIWLRM